jgi:hypothetical protein
MDVAFCGVDKELIRLKRCEDVVDTEYTPYRYSGLVAVGAGD